MFSHDKKNKECRQYGTFEGNLKSFINKGTRLKDRKTFLLILYLYNCIYLAIILKNPQKLVTINNSKTIIYNYNSDVVNFFEKGLLRPFHMLQLLNIFSCTCRQFKWRLISFKTNSVKDVLKFSELQ